MLKMYVWHVQPKFLAVAQASSVGEARALLLKNDCIGESGDGSCPERDKARRFVLETTPGIWMGPNAEFVLTDSAELREQEHYSQTLFARLDAAEKALEEADPRRFVDKFPPPERTVVFIDGGVAEYRDGAWYTGMEDPRYQRPIQWKVEWWMPLNPWPAAIAKLGGRP